MYIKTLRLDKKYLHLDLMGREHKRIAYLSMKAQEFLPRFHFSTKAKEFVPIKEIGGGVEGEGEVKVG